MPNFTIDKQENGQICINNLITKFSKYQKQIKKQQPNISMIVNLARSLQIVLTSLLLTFYIILSAISVYKTYLSKQNNAKFLLVFYLFVFVDTLVYCSMMIYQVVQLASDHEVQMIVLVVINVFSMILETVIIFMLSFYWKETEAILRGSGLESHKSVNTIHNELKVKAIFIGIWFLMYTTFLIYAIITDDYTKQEIFKDIFYFGGQGFTCFLLIWANISQTYHAKSFSFTLKRYQTLVSYQMNKTKFRCIYWIATSINFLRLAYLIVAAVFFRIKTESFQEQWLAMLIYSTSGIIPLAIYLYSFQVSQKDQRNSFRNSFSEVDQKSQNERSFKYEPPVLSPYQKKKSQPQRESFNQTELSSSYDSHNGGI